MSSIQVWPVTAIGASDTLLSPTVNTGDELVIDSLVAHNTSAATRTVEWFLVPAAGTPGAANRIHKSSIAVDATDFCDGVIARVLTPGASIYAKADAVGVNTAATGRVRQS